MRQVHLALAQAVEEWERERTDMLARYWLSAEDHERAKRYACEAAAEARAKLAFDRAAELYETAVELETDESTRAELLRRVGECQAVERARHAGRRRLSARGRRSATPARRCAYATSRPSNSCAAVRSRKGSRF